jgi:hypothetical protein
VAAGAVASLMFWKRFDIGVWYMNRNQAVREMVILHMLEIAQPLIERDVKMSLPQKVFSALAGRRNEKERRSDALKDVRAFGEMCFENRWITFIKAPRSNPMNDGRFGRFRFALAWNRGRAGEVLAAFNANFLKREIGEMRINPDCRFFVDLKLYVETKARLN